MDEHGEMHSPTELAPSEAGAPRSVAATQAHPEGTQGPMIFDLADEDRQAAHVATAHEMEEVRKLRAFIAEKRWIEPDWCVFLERIEVEAEATMTQIESNELEGQYELVSVAANTSYKYLHEILTSYQRIAASSRPSLLGSMFSGLGRVVSYVCTRLGE